jgi:hypothetical protein
MAESACSPTTFRRTNTKFRYNIAGYRKALGRVNNGKAGFYPLLDIRGNVAFYVMHKNLGKLRNLCMNHLQCPCSFIRHKKIYARLSKKHHPKSFYYVILTQWHAEEWQKRMKYGDRRWRRL